MAATSQRLVLGALAGIAATMAMTAAMSRMHRALPGRQRYPLPPREIVQRVVGGSGPAARSVTLAAHFGYGALTGGLFAAGGGSGLRPGIAYGLGVWAASYLGWIPALGILKPATRHPAERNLLMLAAHLVWGAALASGLRELEEAQRGAFAGTGAADADILPMRRARAGPAHHRTPGGMP